MTRIIVAGARGFFGSSVARILRAGGSTPLTASRRAGADVTLDVEDRASIRAALRGGDVVVDATAPFHTRTTTLVEEAVAAGFDVVDVCDNLGYARAIAAFHARAHARGVRLLTACSAVSVLSALAVRESGIHEPIGLHGFLAPSTRRTANRGVTESFLSSVGAEIDVWRGGAWRRARGWAESRDFEGTGRRGRLIETADALTLPRVFPSLRDVDFWVDPNTRGAPLLLAAASRVRAVVPLVALLVRHAGPVAKILGRDDGLLAYDVRGAAGEAATVAFSGPDSFRLAAIPAALAARRLATGRLDRAGVIPVDQHVPAASLLDALARHGIDVKRLRIAPAVSGR